MARPIFGSMSQTSNTQASGMTGGTLGGRRIAAGGRPGVSLAVGDEGYLWILVILEAIAMGILRKRFRRHHGG